MKSVGQTAWLAGLEQRVENHIEQAIQTFQNVEESILQKSFSSGGWSIAQCLAHLNSYGHYYLPRLKQGLVSQPPGEYPTGTFTPSWLGTYLTKLMDPQTGRIKFKAARRHQPADALPAHAVVAEFIDQQEELLRLLHEAQGRNLNAVRIPLSVATWIRLPLGDVLHFLIAHTERHLLTYSLPPLTVQMLVENAVKHNRLSITCSLTIRIFTDAAQNVVVVNNRQLKQSSVPSNRLGLTNIAAKYRLLNQPDIVIHQTDAIFQVAVPLLKPQPV